MAYKLIFHPSRLMKLLYMLAIVLLIIVGLYVVLRYSNQIEYFTPTITCARSFVTLGTYKLTTTAPTSSLPLQAGTIYINSIIKSSTAVPATKTTVPFSAWPNLAHKDTTGNNTYLYIDFAALDLTGTNVYTKLWNIINCANIPTNGDSLATSSSPALVVCLQNTPTTSSSAVSRVFFVKCWPSANYTSNLASQTDSPVGTATGTCAIVGENPSAAASSYTNGTSRTQFIQGDVGAVNTTTTYTLSYMILQPGSTNRSDPISYKDCCASMDAGLSTTGTGTALLSSSNATAITPTVATPSTPTVPSSDPSLCQQPMLCPNGVCTLSPAGTTCANGTTCASGSCTISSGTQGICTSPTLGAEGTSCTVGTTCLSNTCTNSRCTAVLSGAGVACTGTGTTCASGRCTNGFCTAPSLSATGAACSSGATCSSGNCVSSVCSALGVKGATCSADTECISNKCNTFSKACSGSPANGACATTADCANGNCVNSVCIPTISDYCLRNPLSYDPGNQGFPCNKEVGTSSTRSSGDGDSSWGNGSNWGWPNWSSDRNKNTLRWDDDRVRDTDKWHQGGGDGKRWQEYQQKRLLGNKDTSKSEFLRPQKYYTDKKKPTESLKPGFDLCNQYYNCTTDDNEDDFSC